MSLKRNILASYASQIYVILAGLLILPVYLQYIGVMNLHLSWFSLVCWICG